MDFSAGSFLQGSQTYRAHQRDISGAEVLKLFDSFTRDFMGCFGIERFHRSAAAMGQFPGVLEFFEHVSRALEKLPRLFDNTFITRIDA